MKLLKHLKDTILFSQLAKEKRRVVFYSEGKTYWPHLEGVLHELLSMVDFPVCYVSSNSNDPGLALKHPLLKQFKIDEGWIRNWLFENLDTQVMIMTMPDLHQYQVKRSKHKVHYVYIHHSLVSSHMVYRKGAFDHYDSIFCAGPHHVAEIRALEKTYGLPPKHLVEHGYGRLDSIIKNRKEISKTQQRHVLIAPSWGDNAVIETVGEQLIAVLLKEDYLVTLRPHPQTLKLAKDKIAMIKQKFSQHPNFKLEVDVSGQESLLNSDVMISDWSGAAMDYALGLEKPVVFIDVPRKVNNPEYQLLPIEPFEVSIREKIGAVVPMNDIENIKCYLDKVLTAADEKQTLAELREQYVYNTGNSAKVGATRIKELLERYNKAEK